VNAHDAVTLLARWNRELRYDLDHTTARMHRAEQRLEQLEQHIRQQSLLRRDWYRERVRV
jgi:hypothetical protein